MLWQPGSLKPSGTEQGVERLNDTSRCPASISVYCVDSAWCMRFSSGWTSCSECWYLDTTCTYAHHKSKVHRWNCPVLQGAAGKGLYGGRYSTCTPPSDSSFFLLCVSNFGPNFNDWTLFILLSLNTFVSTLVTTCSSHISLSARREDEQFVNSNCICLQLCKCIA